jgi:uncharacterized phage protein (TIGR01671 family)
MTKQNLNTEPSNSTKPVLANRLFKFRAWVKEQNRMIKVFGFNEHLVFEQTWDSPSIKENIFEIEDCHIMQFTGSIDNKGNEIFEGDIVRLPDSFIPRDRPIIFTDYGSWYIGKIGIGFDQMKADGFVECEVIGNVFENPDYL